MRKANPTVLARHPVGENTIQERLGVWAGDVELCETRKLKHTDTLGHRAALFGHDLEEIVAAVGKIFLASVQREPLGPLPTEGLGVDATLGEGVGGVRVYCRPSRSPA